MNNIDITTLEERLAEAVKATGASDTVYTSRPKATTNTKDSFIVAKITGTVTDRGGIASCVCSVHLFAKDVGGFKNTKKLSLMYATLTNGLSMASGSLLFSGTPRIVADTPDDYGYHARIININTTIKTV